MNQTNENQTVNKVELKPKTLPWLIAYIIFSIPGFITSSIILIFVLIFIIGGIIGAATGIDEDLLTFETIQEGDSKNQILVYNLSGPILTGNNNLNESQRLDNVYTNIIQKDFQRIKENENIKGVVFRVNTPGGSIFASEVLGDQINDLIESKGQEKAIYYFDQVVASGGLWASYKTPNHIFANEYGETGSIGVMVTLPNFKGIADNIGYSETVIKSSANKDIGNPFRELTEQEKAYFQDMVNRSYEDFINIVSQGRDLSNDQVRELATGLIFSNQEAKEKGLVDEIGVLNDAIKKLAEQESLSDYEVIEIKTEFSFAETLFAQNMLARFFGVPKQVEYLNQRGEILKPGMAYAIDEFKIN